MIARETLDGIDQLLAERNRWRDNCDTAASVGDLSDRDVEALTRAESDLGGAVDYALPGLLAAAREAADLQAALEALQISSEHLACGAEPTSPCHEQDDPSFEWPDDWCFPCYVRRIVVEALAAARGQATTGKTT